VLQTLAHDSCCTSPAPSQQQRPTVRCIMLCCACHMCYCSSFTSCLTATSPPASASSSAPGAQIFTRSNPLPSAAHKQQRWAQVLCLAMQCAEEAGLRLMWCHHQLHDAVRAWDTAFKCLAVLLTLQPSNHLLCHRCCCCSAAVT
jgi:hypothetical protein